jgi:hypothetical protein
MRKESMDLTTSNRDLKTNYNHTPHCVDIGFWHDTNLVQRLVDDFDRILNDDTEEHSSKGVASTTVCAALTDLVVLRSYS